MGRVLRIGHRGAAGHAPENTLASVENAISLGADRAEVDVQWTSDGHLVIIHDKRLETPAVADHQQLTNETISLLQPVSKLKRAREFANNHQDRFHAPLKLTSLALVSRTG